MDATPGSKKAPPAAAADADADAVPSAAPAQQQAVEQSSSSPESNAFVAGVRASGGGEDDDDQVERFYALLDNIRAMRGMVSTGGGTAAGRKRARDAEPPWRPAFRMEDFELEAEVDSDSVGCDGENKKKQQKKRGSGVKRPADDEEEEEEGEVVEAAKGPRRGQPQPHKARRAGVLAAVDT